MVKRYEKLVRDRIPEIISANGQRCMTRILTKEEYVERLDEKLAEELSEYQESGEVEELVDVIEIVRAIVGHRGMSWKDFELLRARKREERGGFGDRLLLQAVLTSQDVQP